MVFFWMVVSSNIAKPPVKLGTKKNLSAGERKLAMAAVSFPLFYNRGEWKQTGSQREKTLVANKSIKSKEHQDKYV